MANSCSHTGDTLSRIRDGAHSPAALEKDAKQQAEILQQVFEETVSDIERIIRQLEPEGASAATARAALQKLAESMKGKNISVAEAVKQLLTLISELGSKVADNALEISKLRGRVQELEAELKASKEREHASRMTILVGQLAAVVDTTLTRYVLQLRKAVVPVSQLIALPPTMTPDARSRYDKLQKLLQSKGWDMTMLLEQTGSVRWQRLEVTHGSAEELANTNADQLRQFAKERSDLFELQDVEELLEMSALFSKAKAGKPLVPMDEAEFAQMVQAAAASM